MLLEDNWSEFQEQVADGKELLARMDEEQSELRDIESELDGEVCCKPDWVPTI